MSDFKAVKHEYDGYSVWSFEDDVDGTSYVMERDCGDYFEVLPFKGTIINKRNFAMFAGGAPDEMKSKFKDAVSFSFPVKPFKFPKILDPTERSKVWDEIEREGTKQIVSEYKQAYNKAMASAKQEKALVAVKDVNLGTEPSSLELNKDSNLEKGIEFSSEVN